MQYGAALALAFAGDRAQAGAMADDLGKRFPEDTLVRFNYQPTIHAQITLIRNDHARALAVLQPASAYELEHRQIVFRPLYIRCMYARKRIWPRVKAASLLASSRKSWTIAALWSTNQSALSHISAWLEPLP